MILFKEQYLWKKIISYLSPSDYEILINIDNRLKNTNYECSIIIFYKGKLQINRDIGLFTMYHLLFNKINIINKMKNYDFINKENLEENLEENNYDNSDEENYESNTDNNTDEDNNSDNNTDEDNNSDNNTDEDNNSDNNTDEENDVIKDIYKNTCYKKDSIIINKNLDYFLNIFEKCNEIKRIDSYILPNPFFGLFLKYIINATIIYFVNDKNNKLNINFSNLDKLEFLDIHSNNKYPKKIENLPSIKKLIIGGNNPYNKVKKISDLISLEYLEIHKNGYIHNVDTLINLKVLKCNTLLTQINTLFNLEILHLSDNCKITNISHLKKLKVLYIMENHPKFDNIIKQFILLPESIKYYIDKEYQCGERFETYVKNKNKNIEKYKNKWQIYYIVPHSWHNSQSHKHVYFEKLLENTNKYFYEHFYW